MRVWIALASLLVGCDCGGEPDLEERAALVADRIAHVRLPETEDPDAERLGRGVRIAVVAASISVDDALLHDGRAQFASPDVVHLSSGESTHELRDVGLLTTALNDAAEGDRTGDVENPLEAFLFVDRDVAVRTLFHVSKGARRAGLEPRMVVARDGRALLRPMRRPRPCQGEFVDRCARPIIELVEGGLDVRAWLGPRGACLETPDKESTARQLMPWDGVRLASSEDACPSVVTDDDDALVALLARAERLAPGCVVARVEPADETGYGELLHVLELVRGRTAFSDAWFHVDARERRPLAPSECDGPLVLGDDDAAPRAAD